VSKSVGPDEFSCPECGKRFKLQAGMASRKGRCPCGAVLRLPGPEGSGARVIRGVSGPGGQVALCPQCLEPLNGHPSELIHGMRWCRSCALAYYEGKCRRLEKASGGEGEGGLSSGGGHGEVRAGLVGSRSSGTLAAGSSESLDDSRVVGAAEESAFGEGVSLWEVRPLAGVAGPVVGPRGKACARFLPAAGGRGAKWRRQRVLVTIVVGVLLVSLLVAGLVVGMRVLPG